MSALTLHRADPARSMRRLYLLDMQPDLFRDWCLVREWAASNSAFRSGLSPAPLRARCRPRSPAVVASSSA